MHYLLPSHGPLTETGVGKHSALWAGLGPGELVAGGGDRAGTWATPSLVLHFIMMSILTVLTRPSLGAILNSHAACHQNHTASCPSPQPASSEWGTRLRLPQLPALCGLGPEIKERINP